MAESHLWHFLFCGTCIINASSATSRKMAQRGITASWHLWHSLPVAFSAAAFVTFFIDEKEGFNHVDQRGDGARARRRRSYQGIS
jgi:hypothetical protein